MPDISKCRNKKCDRKNECYRYRVIPSPMFQTYGVFDEKDCKHFSQIREDDINLKEVEE